MALKVLFLTTCALTWLYWLQVPNVSSSFSSVTCHRFRRIERTVLYDFVTYGELVDKWMSIVSFVASDQRPMGIGKNYKVIIDSSTILHFNVTSYIPGRHIALESQSGFLRPRLELWFFAQNRQPSPICNKPPRWPSASNDPMNNINTRSNSTINQNQSFPIEIAAASTKSPPQTGVHNGDGGHHHHNNHHHHGCRIGQQAKVMDVRCGEAVPANVISGDAEHHRRRRRRRHHQLQDLQSENGRSSLLGLKFYFKHNSFLFQQQYIYQTLPLYQKSIRLRLGETPSFDDQTHRDRWKPIGDPSARFQIYSAFFDPRLEIVHNFRAADGVLPFGSVRIFSILPLKIRRKDVFCHFRYANNSTVWHRADQVESIHENFGMTFAASYVVCKLVGHKRQVEIELPMDVGLSYEQELSMMKPTSFVRIHYPKRNRQKLLQQDFLLRAPPTRQLAVCVGPAHHNYSNAARIVEFVEYWQLLGAERFYFYNKSITAEVDRVMSYYRERNVAEVLQWNLNGYEFEQELRYEGIFAAINDCLYRATMVGDFHYTVLVDFDEFLLPLERTNGSETLVQFLDRHELSGTHSFNFEAVFFYGFYEEDYSRKPSWAHNTYLYTQVRTLRTKRPLMHHNRSKYVAVGRNVIEPGNHFVWKAMKDTHELRIPEKEGLLFHYRDNCIGYGCESFIEDTRAIRNATKIWHSIDTVCQRLFPELDGICPLGEEND